MYIRIHSGIIIEALEKADNIYILKDGFIDTQKVFQASEDIKDLFDFYLFVIEGNTYISDTFDLKLVTQEPDVLYYGCTLGQWSNDAPMLIARAIYENGNWRLL